MIAPNYVMKGICTRVVDGDSLVLSVSPAFNVWWEGYRFRLHGIDTYEMNAKDEAERALAIKARDFVRQAIEGKSVVVRSIKNTHGAEKIDSFGRYLVEIFYVDEVSGVQLSLNNMLLQQHLAKEWIK